jgi:hypothetical protein
MYIYTSPYVYEIEHIESGKKYIGSRYAKGCKPEELLIFGGDDHPKGYLTSSKIVNQIIENEGNSAFKVNFIIPCASKKEAIEKETQLLIEVDAKHNPEYFNLHNNEFDINFQKYCDLHGVDNPMQIPEVAEKNKKI